MVVGPVDEERAPFPVIVGCPRSGTTLVRTFLDSHPDLAIPGESDVTVHLLRAAAGDGTAERARVEEILARSEKTAAWGVDLAAAQERATTGERVDVAALVRDLHDSYAAAAGAVRSGDKSPVHARHLPLITAALADAVAIHVLRDPRAVVAALLAVEWGDADVASAARRWCRSVAVARAAGVRLGPERYVEVRYEDLIASPEPELTRLCRALRLPWDDAMLDRSASAERARRQSAFPSDHANLDRPLAATRDWRRDLRSVDRRRVEAICADLMRSCGYEPETDPGSVSSRALLAADAVRSSVSARWSTWLPAGRSRPQRAMGLLA